MAKKKGPKFVQYFDDVLVALKELGGSGRPAEVVEYISANREIDDSENELLNNGTPRLNNNIYWARFYLIKADLIDGSQRGIWTLTEQGMNTRLNRKEALEIFDIVHSEYKPSVERAEIDNEESSIIGDEVTENIDRIKMVRSNVLEILLGLHPSGFENLCQRILREAGFEKVVVTGKTGDGGIDGQGILRINHFVSFQVCFQCKRYSGSVGSGTVRDFRGSIMGRADKGVIMTTGTFTNTARQEAIRDGATPIELVDGEQLIDMLEELKLGLHEKRTITIYEIDEDFFDQFRV
jgi:restriction system protein